jgi:hypothetical protein
MHTHKNTAPKQTPKNSESAQQTLDFSCDEIPRIFLHQSARDRERISVELAHKTQKSRREQQKRESCGVISTSSIFHLVFRGAHFTCLPASSWYLNRRFLFNTVQNLRTASSFSGSEYENRRFSFFLLENKFQNWRTAGPVFLSKNNFRIDKQVFSF